LKNRGVGDVCIACCDGLKGLPEAINQIWPQATVQQCVVHLVRASLRYAAKGHWRQITKHLRQIYTAPTVDAAEIRFADFEQRDWQDPGVEDSAERAVALYYGDRITLH
jgi:putative transposase